ncbi:hypothetical protein [Streptomyces sp. BH105]|uniref:hypothetical protein n=1 Tax=Streptomyces sp. BH105 TaxID=3410408 RepID=UPI003CEE8A15
MMILVVALIGLVGVGLGSYVQGRFAARTSHADWLRDNRQGAYLEFLDGAQRLQDTLVQFEQERCGARSPAEPLVYPYERVDAVRNDLRHVRRRIDLLGPKETSAAVLPVTEALNQLELLYRGLGTDDFPIALPPKQEVVQMSIDDFVGAARKTLLSPVAPGDRTRTLRRSLT